MLISLTSNIFYRRINIARTCQYSKLLWKAKSHFCSRTMQELSRIPPVEQLSSRVWRILGCNPGYMTLQGTNTYLIGTGSSRILLDTGEHDNAEYIENLQRVLNEQKVTIGQVILTHWHHDHIGGVGGIHKHINQGHPLKVYKLKRVSDPDVKLGEAISYDFIKDGHKFTTQGATLRAIYTPGHTDDHLCLHLEEDNVIFSGDTVLGEGTSVFEDLYTYMKSLQLLLDQKPAAVYPGHGSVITDPISFIDNYIKHRNMREHQIHKLLIERRGTMISPMEMVKEIYTTTPEHLHKAAAGNVEHHLSKLIKEKRVELVKSDNAEGEDSYRISPSQL